MRLPIFITTLAAALLFVSCAGTPKPASISNQDSATTTSGASMEQSSAVPLKPADKNFDPAQVTEATKTAVFVDVRALIDSLNQIIRRQDYDSWLAHLTDEYIRFYSDPDVLAKYSEYPIIKRKGIILHSLKDYFMNVVYPSRQNDKVDDIEFLGESTIKAITVSTKGDRNILYMLEKHGDAWMIGIGR